MNEKDAPIVFVACKRGTDKMTEGQNCDSRQARNLTESGSRNSFFKCAKCGYSWVVTTGGQFTM